jgi:toxin ParE1/3/4
MKVRYSRRAAHDLESIRGYLSPRSGRGAVNVLAAIYLSIEFIRRNPQASEKTAIVGVRVKMVRKYRFKVFYRVAVSDDTIEIVHVRHTSRRPWNGEND